MIELEREICTDIGGSFSREWLETNGIGGYASGSVSCANTRRYHGLLVAATRPPLGRMVLLSKFEETLIVGDKHIDLSANQYPDAIHPQGFLHLKQFRLDPFPIWRYNVAGVEIERSIFMVNGENTTVVSWRVIDSSTGENVRLEVKPLLAIRNHHHLRHDHFGIGELIETADGNVSWKVGDELSDLNFVHNAASVTGSGTWYRDLEYAIEQERGFDFREDLFQPFSLNFDLAHEATVIATTEPHSNGDAQELCEFEIKRRAELVATSGIDDASLWPLVLAADQFVVDRGSGKTIIAGYHWFSDWGRDTMIALPGLTLATKRYDVAKSILTEFSKHISKGMLPNRFPDEGETPDYNTVDATLWYFEAIRAYVEATDDTAFVKSELYDKLSGIIDWHVRGTRYGIHVDTDGLLYAGENNSQLTWMDAKVGDTVFTPRIGKPVEIQALWYNALCTMSELAEQFDDKANGEKFRNMAEIARESFNGQFWNKERNCLFDVVDDESKDESVRPNQIFAASLKHSMLDAKRSRSVVDVVEQELLTPFGLRSLSPNDISFRSHYYGSPYERDSAYHQGTVWAWLIGPFVDAYRRTHSQDAKAADAVEQMLVGLKQHMNKAMLGSISEIFDATEPFFPRGCAAQAWSVAELLRVAK